mmetsp:Transcript_9849/g.24735  ORF Transcript_9849/g.24735 Transcript_9849/m.24735 type:complete len:128 (-) Transcript_9849:237-620(-)
MEAHILHRAPPLLPDLQHPPLRPKDVRAYSRWRLSSASPPPSDAFTAVVDKAVGVYAKFTAVVDKGVSAFLFVGIGIIFVGIASILSARYPPVPPSSDVDGSTGTPQILESDVLHPGPSTDGLTTNE